MEKDEKGIRRRTEGTFHFKVSSGHQVIMIQEKKYNDI